ncbi:MAG: efflux RND transporter periplasmic adaptor subunit [Planctomycetota bacterium]|nr:MAG: efflux RND transporter periplasmic adaptor subunit [Planctomycetota bacterium]
MDVAQVWTCSMHPQIRMPNPGNCPICGMKLVPAKDVAGAGAAVVLSAEAQQIASIMVEPVALHALAHEVRTVGRIEAAEPYVANLTARVAGRVERVYADSTGVDVAKGDHLVEIYSPDLVVAQEEFLLGLRALGGKDRAALDEREQTRVELAREKLRLFGVTDEQLSGLEKSGKPQLVVTVHAPIGGTVVAKHVREQSYVETGDPLYDIADLSHVWLLADVYEFELPWIVRGEHANVTLEALPGDTFDGVVAFVEPRVDDATRTIKVRIHLDNERRLLKPGMFAHVNIHAQLAPDGKRARSPLAGKFTCPMHPEIVAEAPGACSICGMALVREPIEPGSTEAADVLAVPVTAVLDSGVRRIVWVERAPGRYESAEVVLGPRAGERYPVLSGLSTGDRVVVHGNFLLDSQSQIEGKPSLLFPQGLGAAASEHAGHSGHSGH